MIYSKEFDYRTEKQVPKRSFKEERESSGSPQPGAYAQISILSDQGGLFTGKNEPMIKNWVCVR